MTPDEFRNRAEESRRKARVAPSDWGRAVQLQLAEQLERRAVWAELPAGRISK